MRKEGFKNAKQGAAESCEGGSVRETQVVPEFVTMWFLRRLLSPHDWGKSDAQLSWEQKDASPQIHSWGLCEGVGVLMKRPKKVFPILSREDCGWKAGAVNQEMGPHDTESATPGWGLLGTWHCGAALCVWKPLSVCCFVTAA